MIVERLVEQMNGRGNSTLVEAASVPLSPPQIPRDSTQSEKLAVSVESRPLTAGAATLLRWNISRNCFVEGLEPQLLKCLFALSVYGLGRFYLLLSF
jgi:hypothetical protein